MILVNSWNFSPKHFPFPAFPILLNTTPILPLAQVNIVTVTINLSFILNISKSNTLASLISLTLKIYPRQGYAHHVRYHNSGLCRCHCLPDYCNSVSVVYLILLLSLCVFLLARETLSKWIFRSHLNTPGTSHLTSSTSWSLHSDLQDPTCSSTLSFSVLSLASLFSTSPFSRAPLEHWLPCCSSVIPARLRTLIQTAVCTQNACPTDFWNVSTLTSFSLWSNVLLYPST